MTYTIFQCIKENYVELLEEQTEQTPETDISTDLNKLDINNESIETKKVTEKKERLTKSQKRRQWCRSDHLGELPRGYNWVDIVKHLSQTGFKNENTETV